MSTALRQECKVYYEILDGQPVAMASASTNHAIVVENIRDVFRGYLKGKFCRMFSELDVILSDKDTFIPDVMVVCRRDIIKANGIYGAPDLIVEVLSPSTIRYDRGYKMKTYAKNGVKELWLVDPESRAIEVYLLDNGVYELNNAYPLYPDWMIEGMTEEEKAKIAHEFTPSIFDDLIIQVEDVFEGLLGDFS